MNRSIEDYINDRVENQISYFDNKSVEYQGYYKALKKASIICSVLTSLIIGIAFTVPDSWKVGMSIGALVLSTIVLFTYQWEEFHNYGAKWEKFRLVAEQLKSEKWLLLERCGRYQTLDELDADKEFVNSVEGIIRGTDISYFALMVDPGKRIEKRITQT